MERKFIIKALFPVLFGIALLLLLTNCGLMMMSQGGHIGHSGHSGHSNHDMQSESTIDTSIIRKGKIDVYDIDFNMDGFVYQDPMHWNVISDKPGKCPICGMELEKVKNKEAIKNLKENDFEVKE